MKALNELTHHNIQFLLTDIDDTITTDGQLLPRAYEALWKLQTAGYKVIPVTGRPAGWCEMIARFWPVAGVVGENGGFYFRYHNHKMIRHFTQSEQDRMNNQKRLVALAEHIFKENPEAALASDQFCRMIDLAIDYCEDVRPALSPQQVQAIVELFTNAGAQVKVSSIHINAWFGKHDKATMCFDILKREFNIDKKTATEISAYCGDSPNDEPLFKAFPLSFGVANVEKFKNQMESLPQYIASLEGGDGFVQIVNQILTTKSQRN